MPPSPTSLLLDAPPTLGAQQPRVLTGPEREGAVGDAAIKLAASAGLHLDQWQQLLLRRMLGEADNGKWSSREVGFLVARQNGKGAVLEARELAGLYLLGEKVILHSAHEFKTAKLAYERMRDLIKGAPHLKRPEPKFRFSNEEVSIERHTGQKLRYVARQRGTGRGFTVDVTVLDEAQELSFAQVRAMAPTMLAAPNPQTIYCGTVPDPGQLAEQWTSVRDRGRTGDEARLLWAEWNISENWPDDLSDLAVLAAANPALGSDRLGLQDLLDVRASMKDDPEGFGREICSIWPRAVDGGDPLVDATTWGQLAVPPPPTSNHVDLAFAIDVSPERRCSIGLAEMRPGGLVMLEVVENRPGTDWVPARAVELKERWKPRGWVLDAGGPALSLVPALLAAGIDPKLTTGREMAQAVGGWYDATTSATPTARHLNQAELNAAVAGAVKRPMADGSFGLSRKNSKVDISPLVAVVLAAFGLATLAAPKPPPAAPVVLTQTGGGRDFNFMTANF